MKINSASGGKELRRSVLRILAAVIVHQRIRPVVKSFVERRVVAAKEVPKFNLRDIPRNSSRGANEP